MIMLHGLKTDGGHQPPLSINGPWMEPTTAHDLPDPKQFAEQLYHQFAPDAMCPVLPMFQSRGFAQVNATLQSLSSLMTRVFESNHQWTHDEVLVRATTMIWLQADWSYLRHCLHKLQQDGHHRLLQPAYATENTIG